MTHNVDTDKKAMALATYINNVRRLCYEQPSNKKIYSPEIDEAIFEHMLQIILAYMGNDVTMRDLARDIIESI